MLQIIKSMPYSSVMYKPFYYGDKKEHSLEDSLTKGNRYINYNSNNVYLTKYYQHTIKSPDNFELPEKYSYKIKV